MYHRFYHRSRFADQKSTPCVRSLRGAQAVLHNKTFGQEQRVVSQQSECHLAVLATCRAPTLVGCASDPLGVLYRVIENVPSVEYARATSLTNR